MSIRRRAPSSRGKDAPTAHDRQFQVALGRLIRAGRPERIVLFGSRARGDSRDDSDFDLLVVESESFGPDRSRLAEIARLERALGSLPVAVDLLLYSRPEIDRLRESLNHVVGRALREGRVVYERP